MVSHRPEPMVEFQVAPTWLFQDPGQAPCVAKINQKARPELQIFYRRAGFTSVLES